MTTCSAEHESTSKICFLAFGQAGRQCTDHRAEYGGRRSDTKFPGFSVITGIGEDWFELDVIHGGSRRGSALCEKHGSLVLRATTYRRARELITTDALAGRVIEPRTCYNFTSA
jgi:hypothetical protein